MTRRALTPERVTANLDASAMKYERFEDTPVWKAAVELAEGIYRLTRDRAFAKPGDLCDQLRRAALSISNNVAEGFERGTTSELLMFLYIARGSAGEVRSMLQFAERLPEAAHLKSQISDLRSTAESCSRQLRAWANNLQNTDIRGQRHLNEQTRRAYELERRSEAFWKQIERQHRERVEDWQRSNSDARDPESTDRIQWDSRAGERGAAKP